VNVVVKFMEYLLAFQLMAELDLLSIREVIAFYESVSIAIFESIFNVSAFHLFQRVAHSFVNIYVLNSLINKMSKEKLTPEVLDEMIDYDHQKKFKAGPTFFDKLSSKSPTDSTYEATKDIYKAVSNPLKKMESAYIKNALKNCYTDRFLKNDDFPNGEQVKLCHQLERQKIFHEFDNYVHSLLEDKSFLFQECITDAKNDFIAAGHCIQNYVSSFKDSQEKVVKFVNSKYANYV